MGDDRAGEALLTLRFLQEEVVAAVPLEGVFAASRLPNAFLGAAVRLELGHGRSSVARNPRYCKIIFQPSIWNRTEEKLQQLPDYWTVKRSL